MPNNTLEKWEEKTVKDVTEICLGLTHTPKYVDEGVPFLSVKDISSGYIDFSNTKFITREEFESLPNGAKPKKGDVLFARVGTLGCPSIVDTDTEFGTFVSLGYFRPDNKLVLNTYLRYWMFSPLFWKQVEQNVQGSTLKNLNTGWLKDFKIPIPSIDEQQRIVGILDEAFENIEKAKQNTLQNLNNAKELFESYLTSILINKDNWDKKKLSEVAIDFGRGRSRHRPRNDKKLYGGQYPFIQTGEIRNSNHFITEYSQTYNEIGLAQSKLWPKGTLCITIAANIAETGVLTFDACFPDSVIGCVFDETRTNIDYVEYLLQSFKTILQAEGKGSAQDNINLGTFEKYSFPFPDKIKQDEIVNELDLMRNNIAKLEQIYEQKLKDLDELKQSILQKAFNGEL